MCQRRQCNQPGKNTGLADERPAPPQIIYVVRPAIAVSGPALPGDSDLPAPDFRCPLARRAEANGVGPRLGIISRDEENDETCGRQRYYLQDP